MLISKRKKLIKDKELPQDQGAHKADHGNTLPEKISQSSPENSQFEILPQSWSKRRTLQPDLATVTEFSVIDFVKKNNHRCQIRAVYDNGETVFLNARVYANTSYKIEEDGSISTIETGWGVQGLNANGLSLVLRVK